MCEATSPEAGSHPPLHIPHTRIHDHTGYDVRTLTLTDDSVADSGALLIPRRTALGGESPEGSPRRAGGAWEAAVVQRTGIRR